MSYYRIKQAHELGRTEYLALSTEGKNSYSGPVAVKYTWKQLPFSTKRRLHCDWLTITLLGILSLLASSVYQLGTLITWMPRLIFFVHPPRQRLCSPNEHILLLEYFQQGRYQLGLHAYVELVSSVYTSAQADVCCGPYAVYRHTSDGHLLHRCCSRIPGHMFRLYNGLCH
jgi:hypothetical protein